MSLARKMNWLESFQISHIKVMSFIKILILMMTRDILGSILSSEKSIRCIQFIRSQSLRLKMTFIWKEMSFWLRRAMFWKRFSNLDWNHHLKTPWRYFEMQLLRTLRRNTKPRVQWTLKRWMKCLNLTKMSTYQQIKSVSMIQWLIKK